MTSITAEEAANIAQKAAQINYSEKTQSWLVQRLDKEGNNYYLIVCFKNNKPSFIATINATTGALMSSAPLTNNAIPITIDKSEALHRTNSPNNAQIDLVWSPSKISLSSLYPFWRVITPQGICYIDQQGKKWDKVEPAAPG